MSLILNIDTAIDKATVSISKDGKILAYAVNEELKDQGAFLQPAIKTIAATAGINLEQLDAVAVVAGPGSYTGLRVGMASAKGLCFALNKPLITVGTLQLLASQAIYLSGAANKQILFCPMIDARRMEVFTAVYNISLDEVIIPCAMILNELSYGNVLLNNEIIFFGNGMAKWKNIATHPNARFLQIQSNPLFMSELSFKSFVNGHFADTAYVAPMYIKEFYNNN